MSFELDFLELMPQTISIEAVTGFNDYAVPTFGTATTHRARVVQRTERVVDWHGNEILASSVVWVAPTPSDLPTTLTAEARVTLPNGDTPPLLRVEVVPDQDGPHHMVLYFGHGASRQGMTQNN